MIFKDGLLRYFCSNLSTLKLCSIFPIDTREYKILNTLCQYVAINKSFKMDITDSLTRSLHSKKEKHSK